MSLLPLDSPERQPRVLLCDDVALERGAVATFLRSSGFEVEEAGDGNTAIQRVKSSDIDLVLLDLNMPGSDGFVVLKYLQEHRRMMPVILMSGMPLHKIQHKIHSLPSAELPPLMIKPFNVQQLLDLVDLQLSGGLPPALPPDGSSSAEV